MKDISSLKRFILPAIIAIVVLVVIFVVAKIFINGGKKEEAYNSDIVPVIELTADSEEKGVNRVTITAKATTDDSKGIYSVTSPDGSMSRSSETTYVVTKNGKYTFKAKGNNGQIANQTIEINNIEEASAASPYVPEGFEYLTGEVDTGYVIKDSYGNEYVWVPVENGKMTRNTTFDTDYEETNNTASALVNSVSQYYGFYIARYEASKYEDSDENVATSLPNKMPWTNLTYTEASGAAANSSSVFEYEDCHTAIINSYAWDTTLEWLNKNFENYSSSTSYGNYSGTVKMTGTTESDIKNNIADLAGNVREWTTEIYKAKNNDTSSTPVNTANGVTNEVTWENVYYRVIRGGSASLNRTANSHNGYKESISDSNWGFRMILYK